jgi:hypothetical protein
MSEKLRSIMFELWVVTQIFTDELNELEKKVSDPPIGKPTPR